MPQGGGFFIYKKTALLFAMRFTLYLDVKSAGVFANAVYFKRAVSVITFSAQHVESKLGYVRFGTANFVYLFLAESNFAVLVGVNFVKGKQEAAAAFAFGANLGVCAGVVIRASISVFDDKNVLISIGGASGNCKRTTEYCAHG